MNIKQLNTSQQTLKQLAALVWYCGVVVLFIKSSSLLIDAIKIETEILWVGVTILMGVGLGWLKGKYLFTPLCQKNLRRINALVQPKIRQFYRPQFFIFLASMVSLGNYLSQKAQGDDLFLLLVAMVDLSIAVALLYSSVCFLDKKVNIENNRNV